MEETLQNIKNKRIIIFGAGSFGEKIYEHLTSDDMKAYNFCIDCFVDNDPNKWGKELICNSSILDPEILKSLKMDEMIIIVGSSYYGEISTQLKKMGFEEGIHYINGYDIYNYQLNQCEEYEQILPGVKFAPWRKDRHFQNAYELIKNNTLVDKYRCYELWTLVEQTAKLSDGDIIEVGVWRGGTGALIAKKAQLCHKFRGKVYLCDTFKGLVKVDKGDPFLKEGDFSDTSQEIVEELVHEQMKLENVKIIKGIFPDDVGTVMEGARFRLCHIDVDVYNSAKDIVEWIWDKMVVGGVLVFDDYGFYKCDGVTKCVEEQKSAADRLVIYNLNGHGIIIKIK